MAPFYLYIITIMSLTVILSVIINTYLFVHANKTVAFYTYVSIQVLIILWIIFRMGELFAPTPYKLILCHTVQQIAVFIILPLLFLNILMSTNVNHPTRMSLIKSLISFCAALLSAAIYLISKRYIGTILYFITPTIVAFILLTVAIIPVSRNFIVTNSVLSLKSVITNIGDCIIVLDTKGRIMDANFSFFAILFSTPPKTFKEFAYFFITKIPDCSLRKEFEDSIKTFTDYTLELPLVINSQTLYYLVKITPIYSDQKALIGEIVSFHDITDNKKLIFALDEKNSELTVLNEKLKDYLLVVNQLEEAKEKKEIVFKVQNSIGQDIMELLSMLEVARIKINDKNNSSINELELAIAACRKVIAEIRSSVSILMKNQE